MKIATDTLSRFVDLPATPEETRKLLDDIGVEVKRFAVEDNGVGRMTLELLANRGDHHSYVGLAREISGRTGAPVRVPETSTLTVGESPWPLVNETELCPLYSITLLERATPSDAPLDAAAQRLLEVAELHSVGAVVDATNLVNLELGQPSHAFDADKVKGAITIRLSRAGETCWPLFQTDPIPLPEETLVIADDEKILAIAGVIGCEDSKTTEETTRVLLESAAFDPVAVRKASQKLGLHTDASARFERGSDFTLPVVGAGRVADLLAPVGWTVEGSTGVVGDWEDPSRTLTLRPSTVNTSLELNLTDAELTERLERYGFGVTPQADNLQVRVPAHRLWDVELEADLVEEIAKSVGYNETPTSLPAVDMGALPSHSEVTREQVEEVLLGHGFFEVITDGFYGRSVRDQLGFDESHPLWHHVETQNALDRAYSLLKNNALAQALEGVSTNLRVQNRDVKAFEWTRTFHPDASAPNGVCTERALLWAIACGPERPDHWTGAGRPSDPIFFKGLIEEIGLALGLPLTVGAADSEQPLSSALHPNRQGTVRLGDEVIGIFGEVHPEVLKSYKIKRQQPCYLELDRSALEREGSRPTFEEPSNLHPVERSLAFTLPHRMEAESVAAVLRASGPEWLTTVRVTDCFELEEAGARAITFELRFSNEDANRTNDEVNAAAEAMIEAVRAKFGERGVELRG